jgi:hypothetical protein
MSEFCEFSDNLTMGCGDDYPLAGLGNFYIAPVRQVDLGNTTFSTTAHDITALALKNAGKFVKIEGKVSTKDIAVENAKDGGGNVYNITANVVIPNLDKVRSFILEKFGVQKVIVIVELYTKTGSNRKALVIGLDERMLNDAGATFAFNNTIEAEQGGLNAYNSTITAIQGESPRFFTGAILVEDGSTGETVNLG